MAALIYFLYLGFVPAFIDLNNLKLLVFWSVVEVVGCLSCQMWSK